MKSVTTKIKSPRVKLSSKYKGMEEVPVNSQYEQQS
jgi:hypothetical protein